MRLYFLQTAEKPNGEIWGTSRWTIAAMVCPKCGLCDTFAVGYPVVDLTSIESQYPHRPLRPEEFASLVPLLRPLIPPHLPVRHGQSLGPMTGEAKGTLGDLIPVIGDGATCVRADKFAELRTAASLHS